MTYCTTGNQDDIVLEGEEVGDFEGGVGGHLVTAVGEMRAVWECCC